MIGYQSFDPHSQMIAHLYSKARISSHDDSLYKRVRDIEAKIDSSSNTIDTRLFEIESILPDREKLSNLEVLLGKLD